MKITSITPPTPTPIYTIEGVTRAQMELLRSVLGETSSQTDVRVGVPNGTSYELYSGVNDALKK